MRKSKGKPDPLADKPEARARRDAINRHNALRGSVEFAINAMRQIELNCNGTVTRRAQDQATTTLMHLEWLREDLKARRE